MSRAIFLSNGGDPFLGSFVVKLFRKYFYDEVDRMYVHYNNHAGTPPDAQKEYISSLLGDPKIKVIYQPNSAGNGTPITEMTLVATEDLVMLLEDDGFIFTSGKVKTYFDRIESGEVDAVGSPRFSCGTEISTALQQRYHLDYSGYGDVGPNFWPNFFFCKRKDLLNTDMNFGSKEFTQGVTYKELQYTMRETEYADTFGWGAIQMRHNGVRFGNVPQFHADPFEIDSKQKGEMNWKDGTPFWIHGGSLSAGWGGYLSGKIPDVSNESAKQEIETRVAFWIICSEAVEGFTEFKDQYANGIRGLVDGAKLDTQRIAKKIKIYKDLMHI